MEKNVLIKPGGRKKSILTNHNAMDMSLFKQSNEKIRSRWKRNRFFFCYFPKTFRRDLLLQFDFMKKRNKFNARKQKIIEINSVEFQ